jgi:hypothetical protein
MINEDYITPIKHLLDEKMHEHCKSYIMFNKDKSFSPRWYNIGMQTWDMEGALVIKSTQIGAGISIKLPDDYPEFLHGETVWDQFKKYRTEFLLENYPTINTY